MVYQGFNYSLCITSVIQLYLCFYPGKVYPLRELQKRLSFVWQNIWKLMLLHSWPTQNSVYKASHCRALLTQFLTNLIYYFQINGLTSFNKGRFFDPKEQSMQLFCFISDWAWFVLAFVCPALQSFFIVYKGNVTHKLILLCYDNRDAKKID